MSRVIESKTCPTCGHDKGTVQKFEIPEVPVLTPDLLKPLEEWIKKLAKPAEHVSCEQHPELCAFKPKLDEAQAAVEALRGESIDTAQKLANSQKEVESLKQSHPVLTVDFLRSQENCPNCGPYLKAYVEAKARELGYMPRQEPAKLAPAKEEVPPWRRK